MKVEFITGTAIVKLVPERSEDYEFLMLIEQYNRPRHQGTYTLEVSQTHGQGYKRSSLTIAPAKEELDK